MSFYLVLRGSFPTDLSVASDLSIASFFWYCLTDSQFRFGCAFYTQEAITHSYFKHMHKYSMLKKHCASVHNRDDLLLLTATNVLCIEKLQQWLILG